VWLRKLLSDLFSSELEPTVIHCDNQSSVKLTENPVFFSKHIVMRYYYVRYIVRKNVLSFLCFKQQNRQHICFIKPLSKFVYFRDKLDIAENASLPEREC
jgi:hypothetical protein